MLSGTSARIQWNSVDCLEQNGPIQSYTVRVGLPGGDTVSLLQTTDTSQTLTGLSPGQEYMVQVAASNSDGTGPFSAPVVLVLIGRYTEICTIC